MLAGYSHVQALELELEKCQKTFSLTCEQEESRRVRVDLLYLQDENTELQAQLLEKEERVDALEEDLEKQSASMENLNISMNNLRVELRAKLKEADRLKVEVNSLQTLSLGSAKLLEEKLALAREVSNMRPELEHLRAQQTASNNLLAEKLALHRELQTVQVELENEKRAVQKALSRDEGRSTRELKLETDIESFKADLSKERSLCEKLRREINKSDGQHTMQNASNESRLEEYRAKLKSAKEQIKSMKSELEEARKANDRLSSQTQRHPPMNRNKRSYTHMDADGTIGTPDGFPPKKTSQLLLGEKSGFGLTPYLKQSTKLAIETPTNKAEEEEEEDDDDESNDEPLVPAAVEPVPRTKHDNANRPVPKAKPRQLKISKPANQKKLEQLDEIMEETVEDQKTNGPIVEPTIAIEEEAKLKDPVPRKKRRMLGAAPSKTLFDDDDNATGKVDSRGGLDDFKFAMPKRITLAPKGATALAAKGKASVVSGFGAFSPLKKDRRK